MTYPISSPPPPYIPPQRLDAYEVQRVRTLCQIQHEKNGRAGTILLRLATLVAALWSAYTFGSLLLTLGICIAGGGALTLFHSLRNHDYLDASEALERDGFKQYIRTNNLDCSIDSIVTIYSHYKNHLKKQIERLSRQT